MHADTLKKLQEIGAFVLASGCTKKTIKQVAEMIRAARDYRFIAIYKIVNDEFVILAGTGKEPPAYPRFPTTQGCAALRWNREKRSWWAMFRKISATCRRFTTRVPRSLFR